MAFCDFDGRKHVEGECAGSTMIIASVTGLAVFELWVRHLVPAFFGAEFGLSGPIGLAFGLDGRVLSELAAIAVSGVVLSVSYFLIWRPLMFRYSTMEQWSASGVVYGIIASVAVASFMTLGGGAFTDKLAMAAPGLIMSGLAMSGIANLLELGRKIV